MLGLVGVHHHAAQQHGAGAGDVGSQDTNTTYSPATQSQNGLMSSADKTKLDNLEEAVAMTTEEIDAMFQE